MICTRWRRRSFTIAVLTGTRYCLGIVPDWVHWMQDVSSWLVTSGASFDDDSNNLIRYEYAPSKHRARATMLRLGWICTQFVVYIALSVFWVWSTWALYQSLYELRARQTTESALMQVVKVYETLTEDTSMRLWSGDDSLLNREAFISLYLVVGLYILILKHLGID
jgi:hypothetical protein